MYTQYASVIQQKEPKSSKENGMVSKKKVLVVMVIISLVVVVAVGARAMVRGGFTSAGAGAVVAANSDEAVDARPIQRWQTLSEEELANCPFCDGTVDPEALRLFQEARIEARNEAQATRFENQGKARGRVDNRAAQGSQFSGGPRRAW